MKYGDQVPDLVFVGQYGWNIPCLINQIKASCLQNKLRILNNVSDSELASLYANCLFTAYASLYEGWGLPVSESLAFGKACLCSRDTSLPEAGGNFCAYFNPLDEEEGYRQAEKLIFDEGFRQGLEAAIKRDCQLETWEKVGKRVISTLNKAMALPLDKAARIETGMEFSFCSPVTESRNGHVTRDAIENFFTGLLSGRRLGWENYAASDRLIAYGRVQRRDRHGIWLLGNRLDLAFRLEGVDNAEDAMIFLAVTALRSRRPTKIEFCDRNVPVLNVMLSTGHLKIFRLEAAQYQSRGQIRIGIRFHGKSLCLRSLIAIRKDDLLARIDLLEKCNFLSVHTLI